MRISKSKFVAGVQCLKRLYFQVHRPELASGSDGVTEALFEQGRQVGLMAQKAFPGEITITADHEHLDEAIRTTQELVRSGVPAIFEATFEYGGVLVRTDVLQRCSGQGFRLVEVKSSTGMKPHYAYDIGIQKHVVSGAGISVERTDLMHLSRDYIFGGKDFDVSKLFVCAEITPEQEISDAGISKCVGEQLRILEQPTPPDVKPGKHCTEPVECEFYDHCNPGLPSDHVSLLPRIRTEKVDDLLASGIISVRHIPDDFPLSERQRIAVDTEKSGKLWIGPELADELSSLKYPLCFMDFETTFPALPKFAGMRPYDQIPFQWSVHRQEEPGAPLVHYDFLHENNSDRRISFSVLLCEAVGRAGSIVVYNQTFESSRLDELAGWVPNERAKIVEIQEKLWDLLPVVRRNVYHPDFAGSYSLKRVVKALVPGMSYDGLSVADGGQAGIAWSKFVGPATLPGERAQLKQALLLYCQQDTLALARIIEVLKREMRAT